MIRSLLTTAVALSTLLAFGCSGGGGAEEGVGVVYKPKGRAAAGETPAAGEGTSGTPDSGTEKTGSGEPGMISGKITFAGSAPSLSPLAEQGAAIKDAETCTAKAIPNEKLLLGEGNGVQNVFVYLKKAPKGDYKAPAEPAVFDQRGCIFLPHAMIVQTGQKLLIKNDDPIGHNTHTYPKKNDGLNAGVNANEREGIEASYRKAESAPFEVKCDTHSWMIAYHLPLDHPFGAVTDKDGNFSFGPVPAGDYELVVWHESAKADSGFIERRAKITVAGDTVKNIDYPESALGGSLTGAIPGLKRIMVSSILQK